MQHPDFLIDSQDKSLLIHNVNIAPLSKGIADDDLLYSASIAIENGDIAWLGKGKPPEQYSSFKQIDGNNQWLLPAFIDCHTHLVFAGSRAHEFEMRLTGKSYEEIAKAGGGIVSTVRATREASEQELYELTTKRALKWLTQGVATIEIKSGYGLDTESELKMLRVARRIGRDNAIDVATTFLGAHALPPEYKENPEAYIDLVCEEMLPAAAQEELVDAVDVFCESIGFDLAQTKRVLSKAKSLNLEVKAHVEQLSNLGGSELAAKLNALSVDHVEYLDETGVKALAKSGTVATLLPGAFYFLKETQKPPVQLLRQYNVPMAIATDFNPGSSPIASMQLMLNMACTFFALTPEEALLGVTKHAAQALDKQDTIGSVEVGKRAKLALWDIEHPRHLCYEFGISQPELLIV